MSAAETVLVTGATGTVGSVLARLLAHNGVAVRAVSRRRLSPDAKAKGIGARDIVMELYELSARGGAARVSEQVSELLGRPPIAFRRFAADHTDAFR